MKKIILAAGILALTAGLVSCGREKEPAVSSQTAQSSSEAVSETQTETKDTEFAWGDLKVGMTYDQVIAAAGENTPQELEGRSYIAYVYEDVTGMKKDSQTTVVFVFSTGKTLEEIQYIVTKRDGVSYADVVSVYQQLYGEPYTAGTDGAKNTVWMFQNGYLDICEINDGDNLFSVTFFEKQCYEKDFPDLAKGAQDNAR